MMSKFLYRIALALALVLPASVPAQIVNPAFVQSGAGAVARTFQDKGRDVINAFDYLSTAQKADVRAGTATLDTSAALQAAINAANGRRVRLLAGTYLITAPLQINDQVSTATARPGAKFCGDGVAKTIIINRSGGYAIKSSATAAQYAARSLAYNGEICDLTITTDGGSPAGSAGINLESFWWGRIHDVDIESPKGYGIATLVNAGLGANTDLYSVGILRIERVTINGATLWGIYSDSPSNTFVINEDYIVNCSLGGVLLASAGNEINASSIAGNANGAGGVAGLYIKNVSSTPHNNKIFGAEIDNNYIKQVILEGYHNTITQSRFIQDGTGGTFHAPIVISVDGSTSGYPQENVISHNLFRFDNAGAATITAISIPDYANGTGNQAIDNAFSVAAGLTKYAFAGATRNQNLAMENGRVVYGATLLPYAKRAFAVVNVGTTILLTNAAQKLLLNTKLIDTHTAFDTANQRFIAPYAGVLRISANLVFRPLTTASIPTTLQVRKNNVVVKTIAIPQGFVTIGADQNYEFSHVLTVAAGDYVELFAFTGTTNTLYSISATDAMVTFEML